MSEARPPRRAAVIELLSGEKRAMHASEIASRLGVPPRLAAALSRVLDDLVLDGTVSAQGGHRFRLVSAERERPRRELVEGFFSANPRGFGFVQREAGVEDVFIPEEARAGAMHGDRVRARIVMRGPRGVEGAVVEVIDRRPIRISGTLRRKGKSAWLEPDDARLRGPIVLSEADRGQDGEVVIVDIARFPESAEENPEGRLIDVLGPAGTPDVEVRKILAVAGVMEEHPLAADEEARAYGTEVSESALVGREDLTHLPLPTIDPQDARDHDDAVWAERREGGGYRVWVAIADVSHYVTPGSALDESSRDRGCSIYLPDRAIPMLPRALSSNLCSLLPDVVRLCLCAIVDLDATGTVQSSRIVEGFMRSRAKLTYEGVARALRLTTEAPRDPVAEEMRDDLALLREIGMLLRGKRMRRGALDFDLPETRIIVDPATRWPTDAVRRAKDPGVSKAYQIIEEMMLLANEVVASFLVERGAPAIFRVHGPPDPERIERFAAICEKLGITLDVEDAQDPKKLSAFVRKMKSHPSRALIDTLLIRSLKQAMYDVKNIGHFGLASDAYVHFTSPIRRYPDLSVHRVVRGLIRGGRVDASDAAVETMQEAAVLASERERRAMQVERDVSDLYGVFLMKDAIGDMFAGAVSGVVGSGVFVTLEEPYVSVLVKNEALGNDAYEPDEHGFATIGKRSGERITLSDGMMVQIEDASIERRTTYGRRVSMTEKASHEPAFEGERGRGRRTKKERTEKGERGKAAKGAKPAKRDKRGATSRSSEAPTTKRGSAKATAKAAKKGKKAAASKAKSGGKKVSAKGPNTRRR
ncbi:MAG: ribonuclease R [Polyangiaceae bacterium]|nr:ribonuclease R [Polyangiaceae bacterium]